MDDYCSTFQTSIGVISHLTLFKVFFEQVSHSQVLSLDDILQVFFIFYIEHLIQHVMKNTEETMCQKLNLT